jgi:hypothetical protein
MLDKDSVQSGLRCLVLTLITGCDALGGEPARRAAEGIQDNSFLVEEAYNQEPGVVQHILNVVYSEDKLRGPNDSSWSLVFTQEWPLFSQTHQISFTIPYTFLESGGHSEDGFEDVLLNYRWQALTETETRPAFAPRVSLILPTGDEDNGFGHDTVGWQFNLPLSKIVHARWTAHANAGLTVLPDVEDHDLVSFNLGGSVIYAVNSGFNLMLELIGGWEEEVSGTGGTDREFAAILSPGTRYAFNLPNDAQLVLGLAAPVGLTSEAPDYGVFLYLSFEHPFARPR